MKHNRSPLPLLLLGGFAWLIAMTGVAVAERTTTRTLAIDRAGTASLPTAFDATQLVRAARAQVGVTLTYDPLYRVLDYPGGDVPLDTGVCSDVVVRALRANGFDLQRAVHEDMRAHFSAYPKKWGLKRPDRNIDHRRVPNLMTFFKRRGFARPITRSPADYLPGDIVAWDLADDLPHIGIVSDRHTAAGVPLVIHNIGRGAHEEDSLFLFKIIGHYRLPGRTQ